MSGEVKVNQLHRSDKDFAPMERIKIMLLLLQRFHPFGVMSFFMNCSYNNDIPSGFIYKMIGCHYNNTILSGFRYLGKLNSVRVE